jgi:hypothetical protein
MPATDSPTLEHERRLLTSKSLGEEAVILARFDIQAHPPVVIAASNKSPIFIQNERSLHFRIETSIGDERKKKKTCQSDPNRSRHWIHPPLLEDQVLVVTNLVVPV